MIRILTLIIICIFCTTAYANTTYYQQDYPTDTNNIIILKRKIQKEPEDQNVAPTNNQEAEKQPPKLIQQTQTKPAIKTNTGITKYNTPPKKHNQQPDVKTLDFEHKNHKLQPIKNCRDTPGTPCYERAHRKKAQPYGSGPYKLKARPAQLARPRKIINCYN